MAKPSSARKLDSGDSTEAAGPSRRPGRAAGEDRPGLSVVPPNWTEDDDVGEPAADLPGRRLRLVGGDEVRPIRIHDDDDDDLSGGQEPPRSTIAGRRYWRELEGLQVELVKMQRWVEAKRRRVAILFEGRDAAGKGGAIRRFTEHLSPRAMRVVALPAPTEQERGQWYFQRYTRQLPDAGEIVFFDRSWYNRAVVEPVNGFCTQEQYERFLQQVPEFEHMLYEDGITIVKFWFSISKAVQQQRFKSRKVNPLKQWKLSPIDERAQKLWDLYTRYKEEMFSRTHTSFSPWITVVANDKKQARLEAIRYVLNLMPYEGKDTASVTLRPDPNVVSRFHREAPRQD